MNMNLALSLLGSAMDVAQLLTRSITAANNGDEAEAERLLAEARSRYGSARQVWDTTPGPQG